MPKNAYFALAKTNYIFLKYRENTAMPTKSTHSLKIKNPKTCTDCQSLYAQRSKEKGKGKEVGRQTVNVPSDR